MKISSQVLKNNVENWEIEVFDKKISRKSCIWSHKIWLREWIIYMLK